MQKDSKLCLPLALGEEMWYAMYMEWKNVEDAECVDALAPTDCEEEIVHGGCGCADWDSVEPVPRPLVEAEILYEETVKSPSLVRALLDCRKRIEALEARVAALEAELRKVGKPTE